MAVYGVCREPCGPTRLRPEAYVSGVISLGCPSRTVTPTFISRSIITAETVGQKLNTKNLVQLKVVGKLPRNDTLFRAQEMLRYAGRDSWEPVCICTDTA